MSSYAYCSNNPVNRVDPTGLFDSKEEATAYKKEHHIKGKVKYDGESWSVQDKKNNLSYFKDNSNLPMPGKGADGVVASILASADKNKLGIFGNLYAKIRDWFNKDRRIQTNMGGTTLSTRSPYPGIQGSAFKTNSPNFGFGGHVYTNVDNFPLHVPGNNPLEPLQIGSQLADEIMKTFEKEKGGRDMEGSSGSILYNTLEQGHNPSFYYSERFNGSKDSIKKRQSIEKDSNRIFRFIISK
jgi:hypothetical protein